MSPNSKNTTPKKKVAEKTVTKKKTNKKAAKKSSTGKTDTAPKVTKKKAVSIKKASPKKSVKNKSAEKSATLTGLKVTPEERWKMVAVAAYHRAEKRGFATGHELEDWTAAEQEIDAILHGS
jgi:hypothetical protein